VLNDGKNTKFLIVLIFSLFLAMSGCRSSEKVPKEVREAEKAEMQMDKEAQKEYELAVKNHKKMQSDQSKKIMRDQKKASKKFNKSKKRSLWDRIFNKNCK
jgi:uncharacterized protein YceK